MQCSIRLRRLQFARKVGDVDAKTKGNPQGFGSGLDQVCERGGQRDRRTAEQAYAETSEDCTSLDQVKLRILSFAMPVPREILRQLCMITPADSRSRTQSPWLIVALSGLRSPWPRSKHPHGSLHVPPNQEGYQNVALRHVHEEGVC